VHVRATGPTKPVPVTTEIAEAEVPPGGTASGLKGAAVNVKSTWADSGDTSEIESNMPMRMIGPSPHSFTWDSHLEFNMSGFGFKYVRFSEIQKSCPSAPSSSMNIRNAYIRNAFA
jgi:hypothetical protein